LYNQMIRVANSRVRNKSDAHDVVQEAWVRMLSKHNTLREESKLVPWAKTITRNVASNVNKGAVRSQPCDWNDEHQKDPAAAAEAGLMLEISELLGSLDVHSRTMILYKFYYGFKDQEIADAMNMPVGTVKAKIHRTRERLRRWMGAANIW
jgi:RNA polymerase sigma-70 factor (ECF subfamily)